MARPRSTQAHERVLKAALTLIAERGIEGASMDAIARLSGVSKATVYKHWSSKEELCLEAICQLNEERCRCSLQGTRAPMPSSCYAFWPGYASRRWEDLAAHRRLCGEQSGVRESMACTLMEPRRAELTRLLQQAIAKGELRADLDPDLAMDLLIGPVMHRRFMNADVPAEIPERVVDAFWRAYAP